MTQTSKTPTWEDIPSRNAMDMSPPPHINLPKATQSGLAAFRVALAESAKRETTDPAAVLSWLNAKRAETHMEAELIPINQAKDWRIDPVTGDVSHRTGEFFRIQAIRVRGAGTREVVRWEQPIYNQREGGVLGLLARYNKGIVEFLLHAKAEPGNIGIIQLSPTMQSTMSNLKQAHGGALPPITNYFMDDTLTDVIYFAQHNEEGGRFWLKSNLNCVRLLRDPASFVTDDSRFYWATLGQIKNMILTDNVVNVFVKTIIAPL
ncbi:MAG: NDP-hexose 2,3-dehydratase family protein [Rhodospirillum sp.]|nr:NDP-hexose 2,3-dehydratase family protein [Rhodospirillum sp.]MCF8488083.1 NDP-hexose 2,3-dehydratase family protein [Rhodospirillum sp.]MCF8499879.1 NDP-hexose 2,3-dehydratase family protein [Rhodospirillum sp.]